MPVVIGAKPQSPFADPLGLLSDCHRRIESFLDVLIRVTERYHGGPLDAEARTALKTALAYFAEAAPKHTRDEEDSLFPRMRASGAGARVLEQVEALEADHTTADAGHATVDEIGRRWLAEDRLEEEDVTRLSETLETLRSTYEHHIALEDGTVFPAAAQVLDLQALQEVGREMAGRRGIDPEVVGSAPDLERLPHG